MTISYYQSPMGPIYIQEENGYITNLYLIEDVNVKDIETSDSALTLYAKEQLKAYFLGQLKAFDLPLAPQGTPFMKKVWQALQTIPYGETVTYQDIARKINNERASRAVGLANRHNPLPIIIPCHRVIYSNGKLGGYNGGIDLKIKLLTHEKKHH